MVKTAHLQDVKEANENELRRRFVYLYTNPLTPNQVTLIKLILDGKSFNDIAVEIGVSRRNVLKRYRNILYKLRGKRSNREISNEHDLTDVLIRRLRYVGLYTPNLVNPIYAIDHVARMMV